ncbi:MAG: hypothetical protein HQL66_08020 [Magnetococcales bacterium]|nr:hypothetical protein [Magnetococcales bacterium]
MLSKFILTALLAFAAYLLGRYHVVRHFRPLPRDPHADAMPAPETGGAAGFARRHASRLPLIIAVAVISLALLSVYRSWHERERVLHVRVINTSNGQVVHYEARRKLIRMRSLQTTDGRQVTLADVERMEVDEPE